MRNVVGEFAHLLDDRNNVDSVLLVEVAEVGQVNKVVSDSRHMGIVRSLNLTTNISRSKFQAYWQPKKKKNPRWSVWGFTYRDKLRLALEDKFVIILDVGELLLSKVNLGVGKVVHLVLLDHVEVIVHLLVEACDLDLTLYVDTTKDVGLANSNSQDDIIPFLKKFDPILTLSSVRVMLKSFPSFPPGLLQVRMSDFWVTRAMIVHLFW